MKNILILPAIALLISCGGNDEVASGTFDDGEGGKGSYSVRGDKDDSEAVFKSDDGEVRISTGSKAAKDLPLGLKLYPGAEIQSSMTGQGDGKSGAMITFKTDDDKDKVIAFYKDQVAARGLDVKAEINTGSMKMLNAAGKDGDDEGGVNVSATDDGSGGTQVTIIAGGKG